MTIYVIVLTTMKTLIHIKHNRNIIYDNDHHSIENGDNNDVNEHDNYNAKLKLKIVYDYIFI